MGATRASTRRLGSLFAFYSPVEDPDPGEPSVDRGMIGLSKISVPDGARWRWVLAAGVGAGVGVVPWLLLKPIVFGGVITLSVLKRTDQAEQFGYVYGAWGWPLMHMLLVAFAASWVVRKAGTRAVMHGVLIALVSVAVNQLVAFYYSPPINPGETVKYLVMALGGGLLGGVEAGNVLVGQEALYRASRDISAASGPRAVVAAIEDYLSGLAVGGVAVWQAPIRAEDDLPTGSGTSKAWRPWFSQSWPADVNFSGLDVPALAGADGGAPQTLRAGDLPASERASWNKRGVRSALLLPLVAPGGTVVGLLAVASRRRLRLPKSAVRACLTVGAQAALVLENLRLVGEARRAGRQTGVLKERQRMAHEIHDTLAQGFISIMMNLEAVEGVLTREPGRARHHLDQARLTAREGLTEARRMVWALRPEPLERASLPEALERLAERWAQESGTAAGIALTGTPRQLSPEVETTLFRTAQEALANVRKHAHASRVALTLSYMGDIVALDVRDDGVGFDPLRITDGDGSSGGFGLKGMSERVEQAGGLLSVESAPGEGSTLVVELPMVAPEGGNLEDGGSPEPLQADTRGTPYER